MGEKNQQRAETSSWIKKEPMFPIMKAGVNAYGFTERKKLSILLVKKRRQFFGTFIR